MLEAAARSTWARRKLNFILWLGIPFNFPHRIAIHQVEEHAVVTRIRKRRSNHNHIGGIHACGLATAAEFCSGLVLLRTLKPKDYRLIMQKLEVEYHYQARKDAFARFELKAEELLSELKVQLDEHAKAIYTCKVLVHDSDDNHLCTVHTSWQVKLWKHVRTR